MEANIKDPKEETQKKQKETKGAQGQKEQNGDEDKKDPQTLSQGERMGLSKQQLRKLEKRLALKKKKQQKKVVVEEKAEQKKEKKGKVHEKKEIEISPQHLQAFNQQKIKLTPNKNVPSQGKDNILITSALPYVNNVPHLGNIIGCVLSADVYSRFKKLQGSNVLYVCGTDEYGTATQVKAMQEKKTPKEVCDFYHKIHADVYKWFDIGFDYFGRTSTEWHTKITQSIFLDLKAAGRIKEEEVIQTYCQHCDIPLADRLIYGTCPNCGYEDARGDQCDACQKLINNPTQMKNYFCLICKKSPVLKPTIHFFIDLPPIQHELEEWINLASVHGKWSQNSIAITKAWTSMGLKPKCITRDLKWGVNVPLEQFKKKVFYVWFDAPIGYISITANHLQEAYKEWWQSKNVKLYQFMGKDNVPFHTVIFPSSLIASKQPWTLLHHISTTEYLNYENGKFSKSKGIGVFGDSASTTGIPSEVWRYYLLVNRPQRSDSQFSWKDFVDKNNNQLLKNLGNLCSRVLKFVYNSYNQKIPKLKHELLSASDNEFVNQIKAKYQKYKDLLNKVEIKEGLKLVMQISSIGNKFLQDSQFWKPESIASGRTQIVIGITCNFLRLVSFLIEPYLPSTSAKINFLLGLEERIADDEVLGKWINDQDFHTALLTLTNRSIEIKAPVPLFKEYTEANMNEWRQKFKGKQVLQEKNVLKKQEKIYKKDEETK